MKTFTFTNNETGGKLIITGESATEVRTRKHLTTLKWALDTPQDDHSDPEPVDRADAPD